MEWFEKGRANRDAARDCLGRGHLMAAINRYYYAAYHLAVGVLKERGPGEPDEVRGEAGWRHGQVADALVDTLNDNSIGPSYEFLYDQRRKVDYALEPPTETIASLVREEAEKLLQQLEATV